MIQKSKDYLGEALRILEDTTYYKALDTDPTEPFKGELFMLVEEDFANGLLTKDEKELLNVFNPEVPHFYHLSNIHKALTDPRDRPIISGIHSLTSNPSQYSDHHSKKCVQNLPSLTKDTTDLLIHLKRYPLRKGVQLSHTRYFITIFKHSS